MRLRTRTLLIVSAIAVLAGVCIYQQGRITELETELVDAKQPTQPRLSPSTGTAPTPAPKTRLPARLKETSNIGVLWDVERAMLLDGYRSVPGTSDNYEWNLEIDSAPLFWEIPAETAAQTDGE